MARRKASLLGSDSSSASAPHVVKIKDDALHLGHGMNSRHATQASDATPFARVAAKWRAAVPVGRRLIDVDHAALKPLGAVKGLAQAGGVDGRAQTQLTVVGQSDSLIHVLDRNQRRDRAERFLEVDQ